MRNRLHTPKCRERMHMEMQNNEEDRELVTRAILRQQEAQDREPSRPSPEGADWRKNPSALFDEPIEHKPDADDAKEKPPDISDIFDNPEEDIPDGNDELFADEPMDTPELAEGREDDESEDEIEAKDDRQQAQGETRPRSADDHSLESDKLSHKRRRGNEGPDGSDGDELLAFERAISHVSMKKVIKDLEKDPRLQVMSGNHRQRRTAKMEIAKGIVSEVYSPPRVAEAAKRMGLTQGLSLDLTTSDEEGNPWDFSKPHMQEKANKALREQAPALLIACPMCGPFSSWMNLCYQKMRFQRCGGAYEKPSNI